MSLRHVTQVLSPFTDFSGIPGEVLQRAAVRGTMVHAACVAYSLGAWVRPLDKSMLGYFDAFVAWFDRYVAEVIYAEKTLIDNIYQYTGRPDLVLRLIDGLLWVIDIKTPITEGPTWCAQCAAYRHLVEIDLGRKFENDTMCGALQIVPGRPAKVVPYHYHEDDFMAFLSALNAHKYFKGE